LRVTGGSLRRPRVLQGSLRRRLPARVTTGLVEVLVRSLIVVGRAPCSAELLAVRALLGGLGDGRSRYGNDLNAGTVP
jgi:hypothetical protein